MATYYIKAETMLDAIDKFKSIRKDEKPSSIKKYKATKRYQKDDEDVQMLEGEDFLEKYNFPEDDDSFDFEEVPQDYESVEDVDEEDADEASTDAEASDESNIDDLLDFIGENKDINVDSATKVDDHTISCVGGDILKMAGSPTEYTITLNEDGTCTAHIKLSNITGEE
jgi:hypothetical protein